MNFKKTFDIVGAIFGAVALAVSMVEAESETPGGGAAKKAEVIAKVTPLLKSIAPDAWEPVLIAFLPGLIDLLVFLANRSGFFAPSATP